MRFYYGRLSETAFYYIRIDRSLRQEIDFAYFLRRLLEHPYKLFTDDLALALRLRHSRKFCIESVSRVHPDEIKIEQFSASEYFRYLFRFILAQQSVIYKNTRELRSYSSGQKRGNN